MLACRECGGETGRVMLKKYCAACYWKIKRAVGRDCGLPELHGRGKARQCPVCKSYAGLSSMHGEMPSKKRFIELYKTNPKCAITGHAFDPANDSEQQLPTPDGNLAFVVRFVGNSMRNGHSTFAQCTEARSPSINAVYTNTPENNYPLAPETWVISAFATLPRYRCELNSEAMGILHGVFDSM
ncbi:hypothetical protein T492DRAFT_857676 [Pavlovales sp. CCMP2436]|nr:hypothetical protein T492DRAFT_857676 [Pavlovales sp. CCMP2436]